MSPLFRILTKTEDGKDINYIKCINKRGQYVYVLYKNGYIPTRNKDLEYVETKESTFIPLSIKAGIMDCAELEICGVAFDCIDSLCVINRDENLNPIEKTFMILTERTESYVSTLKMKLFHIQLLLWVK